MYAERTNQHNEFPPDNWSRGQGWLFKMQTTKGKNAEAHCS